MAKYVRALTTGKKGNMNQYRDGNNKSAEKFVSGGNYRNSREKSIEARRANGRFNHRRTRDIQIKGN